jgi:hypothetical protein
MDGLHDATDGCRHFNDSLVGFQFQERLIFSDGIADGDHDVNDVTGLDALAQFWQDILISCHADCPSLTPSWDRSSQGE